jgi:hypothetical protein
MCLTSVAFALIRLLAYLLSVTWQGFYRTALGSSDSLVPEYSELRSLVAGKRGQLYPGAEIPCLDSLTSLILFDREGMRCIDRYRPLMSLELTYESQSIALQRAVFLLYKTQKLSECQICLCCW